MKFQKPDHLPGNGREITIAISSVIITAHGEITDTVTTDTEITIDTITADITGVTDVVTTTTTAATGVGTIHPGLVSTMDSDPCFLIDPPRSGIS